MLFRPAAEESLESIAMLLAAWNAEADHFRACAMAAAGGEKPLDITVRSAGEAYDGLGDLIGRIDGALQSLAPGHASFAPLLKMLNSALALRESVERSLYMMETASPGRAQPDETTEQWEEPWRIAAE
jgi:hypothetical protein